VSTVCPLARGAMFYATTNKDNCNADWALSESRRAVSSWPRGFSLSFKLGLSSAPISMRKFDKLPSWRLPMRMLLLLQLLLPLGCCCRVNGCRCFGWAWPPRFGFGLGLGMGLGMGMAMALRPSQCDQSDLYRCPIKPCNMRRQHVAAVLCDIANEPLTMHAVTLTLPRKW